MLYKPLKFTVIAATILVWVRLLIGTVDVINNPNQSLIDDKTVANQNTQIK